MLTYNATSYNNSARLRQLHKSKHLFTPGILRLGFFLKMASTERPVYRTFLILRHHDDVILLQHSLLFLE
jgi:hypothetical protein